MSQVFFEGMKGLGRARAGESATRGLDKSREGAINDGAVFFAVALPPPVHGQSVVTTSIISAAKQFSNKSKFQVVDIGPGRLKDGLQYHTTRMIRVMRALLILAMRGLKRDQQLYTVFESGFGVLYNLLIIGFARIFGYRIILHHHTSKHTLARQRRFALLAHIAGPDCVHILLSDAMADNLRMHYPMVGNILVSHNACHIPDPQVTARSPMLSNKVRVGFLSNLCAEKGLNVVIDAAFKCRERGLDIEFVIAGPTVGAEAAEALSRAKQNLGDLIEIRGPVSGAAKASFFETVDLFLFPSRYRYEAQPLVLLEAMSYGLPLITTHCGYVKELVGPEGTVFDIDEHLPDRIAERLEKLVRNRDYRRGEATETYARFCRLRAMAQVQLQNLMNVLCDTTASRRARPASAVTLH